MNTIIRPIAFLLLLSVFSGGSAAYATAPVTSAASAMPGGSVSAETEADPSSPDAMGSTEAADPSVAVAEESSDSPLPISTDKLTTLPFFLNDVVMQGTRRQEDRFFEIPKGYTAGSASYAHLVFSHSSTLVMEVSTITLLLDDIPIGSFPLTDTNQTRQQWKIPIGNNPLEEGFHKLSIVTNLHSPEYACANPDNPGNWAAIHAESFIHLELEKNFTEANLSLYPGPLFQRGLADPLNSLWVVPDHISGSEFASLSKLAQYFVAQSGERLDFRLLKETDATADALGDANVLWFGSTGAWTGPGKATVEKMVRDYGNPAEQGGFIGTMPSERDPAAVDFVISGSEKRLANAVDILTNATLYAQLQGRFTVIPAAVAHPPTPEAPEPNRMYQFSFEQMGYAPISIEQVKQSNSSIFYTLPSSWSIEGESLITLKYKHTTAVDLNGSVVAIQVNNVPVGSARLSRQSANDGVLEIVVDPSITRGSRTIQIDIGFDFSDGGGSGDEEEERRCANINLFGNWAVIDNSSTFAFLPAGRTTAGLEQLPYPFVTENRWNATTVLLEDDAGSAELSEALTLAGILGATSADNNELAMLRTGDSNVLEQISGRNIIYIGSFRGIPAPLSGFAGSPVRFVDGMAVSQLDYATVLDPLRRQSAIVQISQSPFDPNRTFLSLATTHAGTVASIGKAFRNPQENVKITGAFVAIDPNGVVYNFPNTSPPAADIAADEGLFGSRGTIPLLFLLIAFAIAVGVIIWLWWRLRQQKSQ